LLAPGGLIALTECSWLGAGRPAEAAAFWREAYPAMAGVADNVARAERAGCAVLDTFALPASAWWDDYYTPLTLRLAGLEGDPAYAPLIAATRREIDLYRRHHAAYGYVFYLMRVAPPVPDRGVVAARRQPATMLCLGPKGKPVTFSAPLPVSTSMSCSR
jgi:serine/threonine-protein kinase HipA